MQVPGEDLTPYRTASKKIWALLDRFGKVQRGGLDEAFLDATDEVLGLAVTDTHAPAVTLLKCTVHLVQYGFLTLLPTRSFLYAHELSVVPISLRCCKEWPFVLSVMPPFTGVSDVLQVNRRVKALQTSHERMPDWSGHVWQGNERIMADSRHRLQDLRIAKDTDGTPGVLQHISEIHSPSSFLRHRCSLVSGFLEDLGISLLRIVLVSLNL